MSGIRKMRKKLGMTQIELAKALNTNNNTVARWENGVIEPSAWSRVLIINKFAKKAGMTLEEVLGEDK